MCQPRRAKPCDMWNIFFRFLEIMFLPGNNVFPWKYTQPLHYFLPAQSCSSLNWKTIKLNYTFISQLFEGFLPPFWRLPPNFLKASSQLSEGFLPTLWMPLPNFLKASSHLSEDFLPTFWRLPPNFVKASSQLSEGFLPTLWGDQLSRFRPCIGTRGLPITGCSTRLEDITSLRDLWWSAG